MLLHALGIVAIALGAYFMGVSEGHKKPREVDASIEVKIGLFCIIVGIGLVGLTIA